MTSLEEAKRIAEVLDSKKAQEVKVLKVADLTFVAEYFVLATGTSSTQVKSLAEEVEFQMKEAGVPGHLEGKTSAASSATSSSRTPAATTTSSASGRTLRRSNCKSPENTLYINHLNHKGLLRNESLRL